MGTHWQWLVELIASVLLADAANRGVRRSAGRSP